MKRRVNACIVWILFLLCAVLSSEILMAHATEKSNSEKTSSEKTSNDVPSGKKFLPSDKEPQFRTEEKISEMEEGAPSLVNPSQEKEHNVQTAEELKDLKHEAEKGKSSAHDPFENLRDGN
jgi:hypothetical protein